MILEKTRLTKLKTTEILSLAEFVVSENLNHHSEDISPDSYIKDVWSIYMEEMNYAKNSEIFVYKNHLGSILASIRVLKWNYIDELPLQKIFGIDPQIFMGNASFDDIWHIGRFAISKEVRDITLFKKLMICAISPICGHRESIAFAECDSKLHRVLSLLGIKSRILGKSINYLGSETIPISLSRDGLIHFYEKNMRLMPGDFLAPQVFDTFPKTVVSFNQGN